MNVLAFARDEIPYAHISGNSSPTRLCIPLPASSGIGADRQRVYGFAKVGATLLASSLSSLTCNPHAMPALWDRNIASKTAKAILLHYSRMPRYHLQEPSLFLRGRTTFG